MRKWIQFPTKWNVVYPCHRLKSDEWTKCRPVWPELDCEENSVCLWVVHWKTTCEWCWTAKLSLHKQTRLDRLPIWSDWTAVGWSRQDPQSAAWSTRWWILRDFRQGTRSHLNQKKEEKHFWKVNTLWTFFSNSNHNHNQSIKINLVNAKFVNFKWKQKWSTWNYNNLNWATFRQPKRNKRQPQSKRRHHIDSDAVIRRGGS